jgi:hypothetical protein
MVPQTSGHPGQFLEYFLAFHEQLVRGLEPPICDPVQAEIPDELVRELSDQRSGDRNLCAIRERWMSLISSASGSIEGSGPQCQESLE